MDNKNTSQPTEPVQEADQGNVWLAILAGVGVAVVVGLGGFFLAKDNSGAMGFVIFGLLPFLTGFVTALLTHGKKILLASLTIGALATTAFLILTKMEGWVCVLMSAPIIAIGMTIGALIGVLVRSEIQKSARPKFFSFLIIIITPFFLVGASSSEEKSRRTPRAETFTNQLIVDASPEVVWDQLKSVDKITGTKGLLMTIGLPVPVSCVMEGEGVGAKRTCYFESGSIEEKVTEWRPPNLMKFDIVASDVPGRPWLTFKDASYEVTTQNGQTVITRSTTIVSRLSPAVYWRPLEKIGVETEHEYLFEELRRRVNGAK
jgi:hypothetical protein